MEPDAPTGTPHRAVAERPLATPAAAALARHGEALLLEALLRWSQGAGRTLEYAAGNGHFVGALHARGRDVVAIEPDPALRDAIRARGVPVGKSLEVLGDERFSAAYTLRALERVEDDAALLSALRRHLEPGGRLLLCVAAFPMLYSGDDARSGCLRRYRRRGLEAAVRAAGFRVTRVRHLDSLGFAVALWRRSLGERRDAQDSPRRERRVARPLWRACDTLSRGAIGTHLLCEAVREG